MKLKRIFSYFTCVVIFTGTLSAQTKPQLTYFELKDVRLLPSPFKHAEDLDLNYLLTLDADRLLAPFLREAGLPQKKESYTNWENTGLDGHIGGHYLSALAHMYASTGDVQIKQRLDYMLSNLKNCQDANGNGYIGGVPGGKTIWEEIKKGNIQASGFTLNGKWVPLYNIHKTYAGLRDAYILTGNLEAKDMLIKMTDWAITLVQQLSETQIQDMLRSEHGGLNETFADVASITQNPTYLALARQFSHHEVLDPLIKHQDKLTGQHANTQIPKVLGFKRIADLAQEETWADAVRYFWESVVTQRSISFGGNSVSEHFNPTNDFSKMIHSIEGPETCNTYNMLRLTKMLHQTDPQGRYLDYYERSLYNHILSSQHPENGGFVYFTQIRPGHYRVYSQPHTSMWCCVGSGMENHAKYGEMIYAHKKAELFVNLFIPSRLNWQEQGVEIIQENNFPEQASTTIHIHPKKQAATFTLHIRRPAWLTETPTVRINGKVQKTNSEKTDFISIKRTWKKADRVDIELPMGIHTEQLPDHSNYYSLLYGPIVLGARTATEALPDLLADDSRMGHVAKGAQVPLRDLPILTSEASAIPSLIKPIEAKPLHFSLSGLRLGKETISMELEPFYKIHDSRYIIYWPQATEKQLQGIQEKMELDEQESLRLNALTIDKIVCGEQQPESDHFIQQEHSHAGVFDDTRWREADGWFSYTLKKQGNTNADIYIKYLDEESPRSTEILINGVVIGKLKSQPTDKGVKNNLIHLKQTLLTQENLTITIRGADQIKSHKILEIRILKQQLDNTIN
ncbi:glycoside hydrolase family 127 protein [Sphingobacterium faecium]|uniref:glycoside hydrolase family 127 protein n=1 Tax=Sphingobacterium faecium TaxID=34087 RepID=UPI002469C4A0|nr:glycoside hydrolase family 127 protein [Sphingobacterium faecium]MDH5826966.1 glycoside hydrolase family 127 protein [Sphingobacterium faecium]